MENVRVSDDEAVSPVIATVLLLAITVMLSSMVFVMMQGAINSVEKAAIGRRVSETEIDIVDLLFLGGR